ncbi:MAG TPA: O-antigen ligase family protein [Flavobacteriales bacterium]
MSLPQAFSGLRSALGTTAAAAFSSLAVLMPLAPNLLPLCLVVGMVAVLVHHRKALRRPSLRGSGATALPWMALLYVLHLIGLLWSVNMDYAGFDLQIKLPFLLLPLLFAILPEQARRSWSSLWVAFILGNAVAVAVCVVMVPLRLLGDSGLHWPQEVFGERFSFLIHPSYFALYLCMALAALFLTPLPFRSAWRMPIALVLCLGVVCCGSKAGWVLLPLVLAVVLVARWRDTVVRRTLLLLIGGSLGGCVLLAALSFNMRQRIVEAIGSITDSRRVATAETSSEVRKLAWHSAVQVAQAHAPFGAGTGDVKDELIAAHQRNGYVHLVEKRINAHQQFLQAWAALGIAGLLLTIALVVVPFVTAFRQGNTLAALFFLVNGLNWTVESMLEVQAGTLFFAFFAFVLASDRRSPSSPIPS